MAKAPWITIIGLGEDGPEGLPAASHAALREADIVMGPPRHLALLPEIPADTMAWPVPFADGIPILLAQAGRKVVVLASGDPFWFGAGSVIARHVDPGDWVALPAPSTFSLAASRMGWPLEAVTCLGLHAAPLSRLRPHLEPGARLLVLLRDGAAVEDLLELLVALGFPDSQVTILEALGGPRERITRGTIAELQGQSFQHPLAVALEPAGPGPALPRTPGLPDDWFETDGVMTKSPIRALTLAALAPRAGERLWDIGGGTGSVAIEWLLAHPTCEAITLEPRADRIALIEANARAFGVDRLEVVAGTAPEALADLPSPDAVFIGGGLSEALLTALDQCLPAGTRLVANAVTLETEALLVARHTAKGGSLIRLDISHAAPLGGKTAWKPAYPLVQWSGLV